MQITLFYGGILAFILLVLSARVIFRRRSVGVGFGDAGDKVLVRRIRAQANFVEYVPITLLLMAGSELAGAHSLALHTVGVALLLGRLLHGWAFSFSEHSMVGRVGGMALTLTAVGLVAALAITMSLAES